MPKLIVQLQGQEWTAQLIEGINTLGRSSKCTLPIKDPSLSREHCHIVLSGNAIRLIDKGSMNGILLNGKRVYEEDLRPGDKVVLGATTLWLEQKAAGVEGRHETSHATRPAPKLVDTREKTAVPAPLPAPPLSGLPPDYTLSGRRGGRWGTVGACVAAVAAMVGLVILGKMLMEGGGVKSEDRDNLVSRNASFDLSSGGKPLGWSLKGRAPGQAQVDPGQGRGGTPCLVLEKPGSTGDAILECGFEQDFALGKSGAVDVSAWTRFEGFSGGAALKVEWLRGVNGTLVAEEFSPSVSKCTGWTSLQARFTPPSGSGALRLSLAAVGHAGRIFFDDVSARLVSGVPPRKDFKVGPHRVVPTGEGVLQIETKGRRSLVNLQIRLESDKGGTLPLSIARDVKVEEEGGQLVFRGKMLEPGALREINFEERVAHAEGETEAWWQFSGADLRQVDRVAVSFTLPRVERVQGVPSVPEQPTSLIWFSTDEGDVSIEYGVNLPRVRVERSRGDSIVIQTFGVDPTADVVVFGIRIIEGARTNADPIEEAAKLVAKGRLSAALELLHRAMDKVKDPVHRAEMERQIRVLVERERQEFAATKEAVALAVVSRRQEHTQAAQRQIERYEAAWSPKYAGKAEALTADLKAPADDPEKERPRRIYARAQLYAGSGKKTIAQALLEVLLQRYPDFKDAAEARQLLKDLSGS